MFLKLRPEFKKKIYIYIYIYVHAQVIQNCTILSRVDINDMDGNQQDVKQRKRKPKAIFCCIVF